MRTTFDRLKSFTADLPAALRGSVKTYLPRVRSLLDFDANTQSAGGLGPYWAVIPAPVYGRTHTKGGDREADDILWAQSCIFLAIRIQDDIFDGQSGDLCGIYAANHLFTESADIFRRFFPSNSSFWEAYRRGIDETSANVCKAAILARDPSVAARRLLRCYSLVNSALHIGTHAACERRAMPHMIEALDKCSRRLAAAWQIIDDLEDVGQDVLTGRFNYAARIILNKPPQQKIDPDTALHEISEKLAATNAHSRVLRAADRHFSAAETIAKNCGLEVLVSHIRASREMVIRSGAEFHNERVRKVFGLAEVRITS